MGYFLAKSFKYFPYPSFPKSSLGMNLNAADFIQYRSHVAGKSGNRMGGDSGEIEQNGVKCSKYT
jgi:hypothetical protein